MVEDSESRFDLFKESAAARFSDGVELIGRPENLRLLLFAGLVFDLAIWGFALGFPGATAAIFEIVGWSDLLKRALFLTVFFANFLMFYAVLRLVFGDASPVDVEDGPMKGYAEKAGSDRRWLMWIGAGMASAFHAIIFFAVGIMSGRTVSLVIP